MKTEWKPSKHDIAFQEAVIDMVQDGGCWAVPITQSIFTINKVAKIAVFSTGDRNNRTNQRICKVFEAIGWTVI